MPEGRSITREQAAEYLRFLKGLGWTHVASPSASVRASERASVETDAESAGAAPSSKSTSQPVNESTPAPSPHPAAAAVPAAPAEAARPIARPDETLDLFAPVEPTPAALTLTRDERAARLHAREQELQRCERCKLCRAQNDWANRLVYGVGDPEAEIVFIGEGPGEEEDKQGIPFVGRAGELLTKIIGAMGLEREQVYICNVIKHRAPGNRDPEADEIAACEPFLLEQLDVIRPRVLVTLGNCATKTLLRTREGITRLRGTWQRYHGIPTMPTYHPAFLLRSYTEANRKAVWSDMQEVMRRLTALRGAS